MSMLCLVNLLLRYLIRRIFLPRIARIATQQSCLLSHVNKSDHVSLGYRFVDLDLVLMLMVFCKLCKYQFNINYNENNVVEIHDSSN